MGNRAAFGVRWWLCAVIVAAAGCGDAEPFGTAAGRVTYHGKALTGGTILFVNASGSVAVTAPINAEGAYAIRTLKSAGLPPGDYQVAVQPARIIPAPGSVPMAGDTPKRETRPDDPPRKFRDPATSGLKAKVEAGENPPLDFDLDKN